MRNILVHVQHTMIHNTLGYPLLCKTSLSLLTLLLYIHADVRYMYVIIFLCSNLNPLFQTCTLYMMYTFFSVLYIHTCVYHICSPYTYMYVYYMYVCSRIDFFYPNKFAASNINLHIITSDFSNQQQSSD